MLFFLFERIADFAENNNLFVFLFFGGFIDNLLRLIGFFAIKFVDNANHHEDNKGDNEEIDSCLDEVTIFNGCWFDTVYIGWDGDL